MGWGNDPDAAAREESETRFIRRSLIGSGSYAKVYKAEDTHTGRLVAIKVMRRQDWMTPGAWGRQMREVTLLRDSYHRRVVEYLHSHGWEGSRVEMVMDLRDGDLQELVNSGSYNQPTSDFAETVLHQMLEAIDFLAWEGIVHRDIKPANILYDYRQSEFNFYLGDFGVCNRQGAAVTRVGTEAFWAPEVDQGGNQTHKVDVWSLAATMLWVLDTRGFRLGFRTCRRTLPAWREVLDKAAGLEDLEDMAVEDPEQRASAAQVLVHRYNGNGLTTPWNQIPQY
ncbi:hypothetical protein ACHAPT_011184 [Fusarium lateritium]